MFDGEQNAMEMEYSVASTASADGERARPPKLDDTIANLRSLMDHVQLENVNALANQDAIQSSYASKKALIQSMLAGPQQAVIARSEQRLLCDREVKSLGELDGIVGKASQRGDEISRMRQQQSAHYTDMTSTIKELTRRNMDSLSQIESLLKEELVAEKTLNGGMHFDPVSLRQQPPESMLQHAKELTQNLQTLMATKLAHHDEALQKINNAFACPDCEVAKSKLQEASAVVKSDLSSSRERCAVMAEAHRPLDEADREKVLALKKDLEDLEAAEKVHKAAEAALEEERKQSQHVAQKMIGFYQSIPAKKDRDTQ